MKYDTFFTVQYAQYVDIAKKFTILPFFGGIDENSQALLKETEQNVSNIWLKVT